MHVSAIIPTGPPEHLDFFLFYRTRVWPRPPAPIWAPIPASPGGNRRSASKTGLFTIALCKGRRAAVQSANAPLMHSLQLYPTLHVESERLQHLLILRRWLKDALPFAFECYAPWPLLLRCANKRTLGLCETAIRKELAPSPFSAHSLPRSAGSRSPTAWASDLDSA